MFKCLSVFRKEHCTIFLNFFFSAVGNQVVSSFPCLLGHPVLLKLKNENLKLFLTFEHRTRKYFLLKKTAESYWYRSFINHMLVKLFPKNKNDASLNLTRQKREIFAKSFDNYSPRSGNVLFLHPKIGVF